MVTHSLTSGQECYRTIRVEKKKPNQKEASLSNDEETFERLTLVLF